MDGHVVLVDDEGVKRVLEPEPRSAGFRVTAVRNGNALSSAPAAAETAPGVVIVAVVMPRTDGFRPSE
jgi:DNA-binding response OmpR family regulator